MVTKGVYMEMEKEFKRGEFDLPPGGLSEDEITSALGKFDDYLKERKQNFLGFQAYQDLHYSFLASYLDCQINNLGDPYEDGDFKIK